MIVSTALVTLIMGLIAVLVTTKEAGLEIDDKAVCWSLTLLIILFMFCVGLALVSFPWILMGGRRLSYLQRDASSLNFQLSGSPLI